MLISNEKNIITEKFSSHGGNSVMNIKFAFKDYQYYGNNNDSKWNCFAVAELPVGATAGYHKHKDTDEFFYIIDGLATITIDRKTKVIKKGDIILTRKGSSHGITNVKKRLKFTVTEIFR
jgi:mannose-6-phosphate isomerase-like protein (cupin superfamily)